LPPEDFPARLRSRCEISTWHSVSSGWDLLTDVEAEVPPVTDLYTLPDDIVATNPEAQPYKFIVDDQVVLVDPTKMRAIAVIGPKVRD
jgi:hypothetical protein